MPDPVPAVRPGNPRFSSGPCAKRPGWTCAVLDSAFLGRSHRAPGGKVRLVEVIERSKRVLGLPEDHLLALVPASDTGAVGSSKSGPSIMQPGTARAEIAARPMVRRERFITAPSLQQSRRCLCRQSFRKKDC